MRHSKRQQYRSNKTGIRTELNWKWNFTYFQYLYKPILGIKFKIFSGMWVATGYRLKFLARQVLNFLPPPRPDSHQIVANPISTNAIKSKPQNRSLHQSKFSVLLIKHISNSISYVWNMWILYANKTLNQNLVELVFDSFDCLMYNILDFCSNIIYHFWKHMIAWF